MLSRKQGSIQRGQVITADRLNRTDYTAARADGMVPGGGGGQLRIGGIGVSRPPTAQTLLLTVEIAYDAVPAWWAAASSGGPTDIDNGLVLTWDYTLGDWAYTGTTVAVTADSLPLLAGDRALVYFDYSTGLWYPARQNETFWARPLSTSTQSVMTPDGSGLTVQMFPAVIQLWQDDTLTFFDTTDTQAEVVQNCWLFDPRTDALDTAAGYPCRLVGYVGGFPVFALTGSSSTVSRVLVQITDRTYSGASAFSLYSSNLVKDDTTPAALTYTSLGTGPDFYSLNDVDLPVGLVCWVSKSSNGTWYLNDNDTRVDVVTKTGTSPDTNGLYDGTLFVWDHVTHTLVDRGAIKVVDISGP